MTMRPALPSGAHYGEFVDCLFANEPVLVYGVGSDWSLNEHTVQALLDELCESAVTTPVDVQLAVQRGEGGGECRREMMPFGEFVRRAVVDGERGLYAKDFHVDQLARRCTESGLYQVPLFFQDDWLNWYWQVCRAADKDDYSFLYVGGQGSITGVHHDVLCSYSWSLNVKGRKRWFLVPPSAAAALFSVPAGELVEDLRPGKYDERRFPELSRCPCFELLQEPGSALFVPSGWYHMVENLDRDRVQDGGEEGALTVSVNRNWFNAFSLARVWRFLHGELLAVRTELVPFRAEPEAQGEFLPPSAVPASVFSPSAADTSGTMGAAEWLQHCETLLRANAALGLADFTELVAARSLFMHHCLLRIAAGPPAWCGDDVPGRVAQLCPRFCAECVTDSDVGLCRLLLDTRRSCLRGRPGAALPGQVATAAVEDNSDDEGEGGVADGHDAGAGEPSVWAFTCREIRRVVCAMTRCQEALEHLGATVGSAPQAGAGAGAGVGADGARALLLSLAELAAGLEKGLNL